MRSVADKRLHDVMPRRGWSQLLKWQTRTRGCNAVVYGEACSFERALQSSFVTKCQSALRRRDFAGVICPSVLTKTSKTKYAHIYLMVKCMTNITVTKSASWCWRFRMLRSRKPCWFLVWRVWGGRSRTGGSFGFVGTQCCIFFF